EGQLQSAALLKAHRQLGGYTSSQSLRRLNEFRSQVDSGHIALVRGSKVARASADTGPHIQEAHARPQTHLRCDRFRGLSATDMKLIHRRQVIQSERRARLSICFKYTQDSLFQLSARVMLRDLPFHGRAGGIARWPRP